MPDFLLLEVPATGVGAPSTSARSCAPRSLVGVRAALVSDTLEGGAGEERGARGKPTSQLSQSEARCPVPLSLPKILSFFQKGAKPSSASDKAEVDGLWAQGGIWRERHPSEIRWPGAV